MEAYRSGHNGPDSKWSTRLFVLSTRKSSRDAGLSQFKKVNILLFCPVVLSSVFFQNFRLNIWRVVRVVEGAALEMLCSQKEPRVRIPNSPPKSPVTMRVCWTFLFSPSGLCPTFFCGTEQLNTDIFLLCNRFIVRFFLSHSTCSENLQRPARTFLPPWPVRRISLTNNPNAHRCLRLY